MKKDYKMPQIRITEFDTVDNVNVLVSSVANITSSFSDNIFSSGDNIKEF